MFAVSGPIGRTRSIMPSRAGGDGLGGGGLARGGGGLDAVAGPLGSHLLAEPETSVTYGAGDDFTPRVLHV